MSEPIIPGGYILLSRKLIESEIWDKPPLYIKIWVYLLTRAQHGDYKNLKRGQLRTSIPEIMEACSWYVGYRKVKPTKDQVYQVIDWLRKPCESTHESNNSPTMITTTKATQGLLINIDNYWFYQDSKNYESNSVDNNEKDTKELRKQLLSDNINKNDNNYKNNNINIPFPDIINYLNKKTGKNFRDSTKKTRDLITARWNEGFREEDFYKVIDVCCSKWKGQTFTDGAKGDDYLQPSTLFNNKFEERLHWTQKAKVRRVAHF